MKYCRISFILFFASFSFAQSKLTNFTPAAIWTGNDGGMLYKKVKRPWLACIAIHQTAITGKKEMSRLFAQFNGRYCHVVT